MTKKTSKLKELSKVFSKNNITADTIEAEDTLIFEIKRLAGTVKDYRHESYIRHNLTDVIMIVFFAVLAAADEWSKKPSDYEKNSNVDPKNSKRKIWIKHVKYQV